MYSISLKWDFIDCYGGNSLVQVAQDSNTEKETDHMIAKNDTRQNKE